MVLLKVEGLKVEVEKKQIVNGVSFSLERGENLVILGPNASGKSSLANAIAGLPQYKIKEGRIIFNGIDVTYFSPEKRVKLGIVLAFQHPPAIRGVKFSSLLEKISKKRVNYFGFDYLKDRELNVGFSGGEKKISELLQVLSLSPKLAILDEIDSGLDMKMVERIGEIVRENLTEKNVATILITHRGDILKTVKPDKVAVMLEGRIVCVSKNWKKILEVVKKYGYEKCKECRECELLSS
ncbi:MAG: ABC transporter ATP-binding protein [Candidatus Aenigmarchaeota archaeon]|nr:ABC transporter ATP-binding protein [Candidatus Aenigmarchaeota archaeon]MDW8160100.1 ABC transporter ATP-binding protein [Candidatus Aenigmarchaeota archaeon]